MLTVKWYDCTLGGKNSATAKARQKRHRLIKRGEAFVEKRFWFQACERHVWAAFLIFNVFFYICRLSLTDVNSCKVLR